LLAHILFDLVFFHYKENRVFRKAALVLSLLSFGYIVAAALMRNPLIFA